MHSNKQSHKAFIFVPVVCYWSTQVCGVPGWDSDECRYDGWCDSSQVSPDSVGEDTLSSLQAEHSRRGLHLNVSTEAMDNGISHPHPEEKMLPGYIYQTTQGHKIYWQTTHVHDNLSFPEKLD